MRIVVLASCVAALLGAAAPARADWSASAFLGASFTAPATLTLDRPAAGAQVQWADVPLDARSFASPPYYGYRIGWTPASHVHLGVEAELIHLKVYTRAGALAPAVERFSVSHGLNLLLGNVVWRQPLRGAIRLAVRGGAGIGVPHGESRVGGIDREQYEVSWIALQAAAG